MRFDAYAASVEADPVELVAGLVPLWDLASVRNARGMHGYLRGAEVHRGDRVLARVWWEGTGPDPHVQATGECAPVVAEYLRGLPVRHEVARVDVCEDYTAPGAFEMLSKLCFDVADEHNIAVQHQGDWHRGIAGRTVYLGAPTSPTRVRCYEKGRQLGTDPNWVRVEVQVRPKRGGRELCARARPSEVWGCSRWSGVLASRLGVPDVERMRVGTCWREPDYQRARVAMLAQYGRTLRAWAAELGGSWTDLGEAIARELDA